MTDDCCRIPAMKNRLTLFLLLSTTLFLYACTMWGAHPVTKWKDATGGEGLEQTFWREVKAKQWDGLGSHIASNYIAVSPEEGRFDKAAFIAHLQQLRLDDYTLGDFHTELNSETFVVAYTIVMRGTLAGQPLPAEPVRMMTVWQKQSAGWMAIAHSVQGPEKK